LETKNLKNQNVLIQNQLDSNVQQLNDTRTDIETKFNVEIDNLKRIICEKDETISKLVQERKCLTEHWMDQFNKIQNDRDLYFASKNQLEKQLEKDQKITKEKETS